MLAIGFTLAAKGNFGNKIQMCCILTNPRAKSTNGSDQSSKDYAQNVKQICWHFKNQNSPSYQIHSTVLDQANSNFPPCHHDRSSHFLSDIEVKEHYSYSLLPHHLHQPFTQPAPNIKDYKLLGEQNILFSLLTKLYEIRKIWQFVFGEYVYSWPRLVNDWWMDDIQQFFQVYFQKRGEKQRRNGVWWGEFRFNKTKFNGSQLYANLCKNFS